MSISIPILKLLIEKSIELAHLLPTADQEEVFYGLFYASVENEFRDLSHKTYRTLLKLWEQRNRYSLAEDFLDLNLPSWFKWDKSEVLNLLHNGKKEVHSYIEEEWRRGCVSDYVDGFIFGSTDGPLTMNELNEFSKVETTDERLHSLFQKVLAYNGPQSTKNLFIDRCIAYAGGLNERRSFEFLFNLWETASQNGIHLDPFFVTKNEEALTSPKFFLRTKNILKVRHKIHNSLKDDLICYLLEQSRLQDALFMTQYHATDFEIIEQAIYCVVHYEDFSEKILEEFFLQTMNLLKLESDDNKIWESLHYLSQCHNAFDKGQFIFKDDDLDYYIVNPCKNLSPIKSPHVMLRLYSDYSIHIFELEKMRFTYHSKNISPELCEKVSKLMSYMKKHGHLRPSSN